MHLLGALPAAAGFLLWARPAGDIDLDRLLHRTLQHGMQRANAGSAMLSAYSGS